MLYRAIFVFVLTYVGYAHGAVVATRAEVTALLGTTAVTESFESYVPPAGAADLINTAVLDNTSVLNGQGPGLVLPGVTFRNPQFGLQWNDAGFFGQPSRDLRAEETLTIDFRMAVRAFGLDLLTFAGFPDSALLSIFGADDSTLLASFVIPLASPSTPVFFGYEDAAGIGRVDLSNAVGSPVGGSPNIDNLLFAVGEPQSVVLVLFGLVALFQAAQRRTLVKITT